MVNKTVGSFPQKEIDYLPFEMGYLSPFFQMKAETELHETPENLETCLKAMQEKSRENNWTFEDDFLIQYLRCRKYNVDRAFSQLKAFVKMKRKHMDMFTNIRFQALEVSTRNNIVTFLPRRCTDGCTILLAKLDNWYPEQFPLEELKRMLIVMLLQSLRDPMTQVNGFKVIVDVKSNPLRHLRYITPSNLYLLYHGTQECVPGRFKGIHVLNDSLTFKVAWMLLKPFLTEKFKKRFCFHSDLKTLKDFFPESILPVEYGGTLKDYDMTDWLKRVTEPEKLAAIGVSASPV